MLSYEFILALSKEAKYKYSKKTATQYVIIAQKADTLEKQNKYKLELFFLMNKIIVKNTENFFHLCRGYKKQCMSKEDLIGEFYWVLHKCVRDYRLGKGDFYWYYNKSLTLHSLRLRDKYYKKPQNLQFTDNEHILDFSTQNEGFDLTDFEMDNLNLTDEERDVVKSRLDGEKINDYIENKNMSSNQYYKHLTNIKIKMKHEIIDS